MSLFGCCFAPKAKEDEFKVPHTGRGATASFSKQGANGRSDAMTSSLGSLGSGGSAVQRAQPSWSQSWSQLNNSEAAAVQQTLAKVGELIEKFAEGRGEKMAPLQALKKSLQHIVADSQAKYASVSLLSPDMETFMVLGTVGAPAAVAATGADAAAAAAAAALRHGAILPARGGNSSVEALIAGGSIFSWNAELCEPPPSDWEALTRGPNGLRMMYAAPLRQGLSLLGALNLGFEQPTDVVLGGPMFHTYLSLVSATIASVAKEPALGRYLQLGRELAGTANLDALMARALSGVRAALGGGLTSHMWLRAALISADSSAAMLFDDLSQPGATRAPKRAPSGASAGAGGGSFSLVREIQAAGGMLRTNIPMKSTVLRIALTNRKQVLIPDVQKLINQLGNVNTDLFASRLVKPPTSVLLLPLRAQRNHIFGALYALSDVQTDFSELAVRLKEVSDLLGGMLLASLSGNLAAEYALVQQLSQSHILAPDVGAANGGAANGSSNSRGGAGGVGSPPPSSGVPSGVVSGPASAALSFGRGGGGDSFNNSGGGGLLTPAGYERTAAAFELGSTVGSCASFLSAGAGGSLVGGPHNSHSFTLKQPASSTGALVTGLTEKLNQKRIDVAMHADGESNTLRDLQLLAQIGEGGFAKVFRGLWRGLVVAVKVVAAGDPGNERSVMKNAHEIAILSALSHPNILQAYHCLTDVRVRDVVAACVRPGGAGAGRASVLSALTQGVYGTEEALCHIEVVEYCDLGNMNNATRGALFAVPGSGGGGHGHGGNGGNHSGIEQAVDELASATGPAADAALVARVQQLRVQQQHAPSSTASPQLNGADGTSGSGGPLRVNVRALLLTLLEVASAMAHLHQMGVVHCDMKPANLLLKSSSSDVRGFTVKVSDFGLSRVEDDDTCETFPYNSCGTAAYVAPEALVTQKKVNASVDVYAFGIIMWEVLTGQRPYGSMKQQQVVEEVVLRGLRPRFLRGAPPAYIALSQACWAAAPAARPSFATVIDRLQDMLAELSDDNGAADEAIADGAAGAFWHQQAQQQQQHQQQQHTPQHQHHHPHHHQPGTSPPPAMALPQSAVGGAGGSGSAAAAAIAAAAAQMATAQGGVWPPPVAYSAAAGDLVYASGARHGPNSAAGGGNNSAATAAALQQLQALQLQQAQLQRFEAFRQQHAMLASQQAQAQAQHAQQQQQQHGGGGSSSGGDHRPHPHRAPGRSATFHVPPSAAAHHHHHHLQFHHHQQQQQVDAYGAYLAAAAGGGARGGGGGYSSDPAAVAIAAQQQQLAELSAAHERIARHAAQFSAGGGGSGGGGGGGVNNNAAAAAAAAAAARAARRSSSARAVPVSSVPEGSC